MTKAQARRRANINIAEATERIYKDAEAILAKMCPKADRNSEAFKDTVFRLACEAMVDAFVRLRCK